MEGIEPSTFSLPRKHSTTELQRLTWSGRRDSNPRPSAWKADALPTELLPQYLSWGEEDSNLRSFRNRFTVCPIWPLWNLPKFFKELKVEPAEGLEPPTS